MQGWRDLRRKGRWVGGSKCGNVPARTGYFLKSLWGIKVAGNIRGCLAQCFQKCVAGSKGAETCRKMRVGAGTAYGLCTAISGRIILLPLTIKPTG
jgi:hypothetical protein